MGSEMKKFLSLALILSTTVAISSCSERSEGGRRPDAVYQRTIDNPELGGATSISGFDSPISDNIGSTRLFSADKSKAAPSQKKTKLESKASLPEVIEEVKAPVIELPEEPEQLPEKIEVAEEQTTPKELSALAPQVKETNLSILNMRPVSPEENVQIISLSKDGTPQESPQKYIRQEVKEEERELPVESADLPAAEPVEVAKTVAVTNKKNFAMPASLAYKIKKDDNIEDAPKIEGKEEDGPTVIEKVAEIFTGSDKEEKKETSEQLPESAELPAPDAANVGECMAKVVTPGEYKEVEEQVLLSEATTKTMNIPAEYKETEEDVVLTPEKQEEIIIPAVYKDVEEDVLVTPGQKSWKKVDGKGDVMQLVEEKAVYKKVVKKVLVEEERRETKITPAVTKKVKKNVLVKEASTSTIDVPAKYNTVKKMVAVTPDKVEWLPALCENKIDRDTTKRIQGALITKGYDIRIVDGSLGPVTRKALFDYQKSIGYDSSAIVLRTIESLGLSN